MFQLPKYLIWYLMWSFIYVRCFLQSKSSLLSALSLWSQPSMKYLYFPSVLLVSSYFPFNMIVFFFMGLLDLLSWVQLGVPLKYHCWDDILHLPPSPNLSEVCRTLYTWGSGLINRTSSRYFTQAWVTGCKCSFLYC